jgi:ADP-ribosyl-[dinitrogen reductase] hydrolase
VTPSARERIVGCLLGGAIGDALGAGIEFQSWASIRSRHGDDGVTGFVPCYGRAVAVTDDTQMTLFTAEGLLVARATGRPVVDAIRDAYLRWLSTQTGRADPPPGGWLLDVTELHEQRAPGTTCLSALRSGGSGTTAEPINDSKGCGGVMRVAPIGLVADDAFGLAAEAAALTHGHPSGFLSAGAFAAILASICRGRALPDAIADARDELVTWRDHDETTAALDAAVALSHSDLASSAATVESLGGGWVGEEALAISLYCALSHLDDARAALLLAVNHSGDSDSTGAITGHLLGAVHGPSAFPAEWIAELELRAVVEQIAQDLADVFVDGTAPSAHRYSGALR